MSIRLWSFSKQPGNNWVCKSFRCWNQIKRQNYISSNPLLKLDLSLWISAMGAWSDEILIGQRLMNQKYPRYRALPNITSGPEVQQFFKIQTVWKPDIFLSGHQTFNTFKNRKKIKKFLSRFSFDTKFV